VCSAAGRAATFPDEARRVKNPSIQDLHAPLLPLELWAPGTEVLRTAPASVRGWLTEEGLLTDRIAASSGEPATLKLIDQRVGFLSREQQALLRAPAASCFVREIVLNGRGKPWVFAQTLVPDCTLEQHPWLAELGEASLGSTLAGLGGIERGPFEFAPLPDAHPLGARALASASTASGSAWARRSWFALRGARLLVQEVFLTPVLSC
jgi:chorismate lyase